MWALQDMHNHAELEERNAGVDRRGDYIVMVAVRDIPAGSEVPPYSTAFAYSICMPLVAVHVRPHSVVERGGLTKNSRMADSVNDSGASHKCCGDQALTTCTTQQISLRCKVFA